MNSQGEGTRPSGPRAGPGTTQPRSPAAIAPETRHGPNPDNPYFSAVLGNLAPLCRHHHQCKQAEGWRLEQPEPGALIWHTPVGRTYATAPTRYPA
jgi:hypothetical protein